jgi:uncharacterized protein
LQQEKILKFIYYRNKNMTAEITILFYSLLFIVAFLYASVGHGGASGYLALGAIFNMAKEVMRPAALLLNLFVSLTSFIQFYRGRHFIFRIFLPLALASVPMAFIGGQMTVNTATYKLLLGLLLLVPIVRFLFFPNITVSEIRKSNGPLSLLLGGVIGFVSGMIGIGGGIILSPILLLLKWTDQKQTAAISALFIFVNSLSGLLGQLTNGLRLSSVMMGYVGVAFAGGLCGAYFGAMKFNQHALKILLAIVLIMAAYKLIFTHA